MKKSFFFAGLGVILAIWAAFGVTEKMLFDPDPPNANYPEPKTLKDAQLQDLEYLSNLFELDRSYSKSALAEAKKLHQQTMTRAGEFTEAEFELAVSRIFALADNAHSNVLGFLRSGKYPRIPARTYWFDDGLYIVRATEKYRHLLGGKILKVDGHSLEEVYRTLRPFIGGPETYFKGFPFVYLFEFPEILNAAGIAKNPNRVELELLLPSNEVETIEFEGAPIAEEKLAGHPYHMLIKDPLPGEGTWYNLLQDKEHLDLTFETGKSFHLKSLKEQNGYYVRYWANNDVGPNSIEDFNEEVEAALVESAPLDFIFLDLRNNRGGNNQKTKKTMLGLGNFLKPDGRLYIAVGRDTFSAGMGSLAFAKSALPERAFLVGTRPGDRETYWGEDNRFILPNSQIRGYFSRGLHKMTEPCRDVLKCTWGNIFTDYFIESIEPDIPVSNSFEAYAKGQDPILRKVLELESQH